MDNSGTGEPPDQAGKGSEVFPGESSPPSDPPIRRNGNAERRNDDFERILNDVSTVIAAGVVKAHEYRELARQLHISVLQAEVAVRQLRDRGRLPEQASAA